MNAKGPAFRNWASAAVCLLIFAFVNKGLALKCYECLSTIKRPMEACKYADKDKLPLVDCGPGIINCLTAEYEIGIDKHGFLPSDWVYQRGCSSYTLKKGKEYGKGGCLKNTSPSSTSMTWNCLCDTDGCNHAGRVRFCVWGIFVLVLMSLCLVM